MQKVLKAFVKERKWLTQCKVLGYENLAVYKSHTGTIFELVMTMISTDLQRVHGNIWGQSTGDMGTSGDSLLGLWTQKLVRNP